MEGRWEEAEKLFEQVWRSIPKNAAALVAQSGMRKMTKSEARWLETARRSQREVSRRRRKQRCAMRSVSTATMWAISGALSRASSARTRYSRSRRSPMTESACPARRLDRGAYTRGYARGATSGSDSDDAGIRRRYAAVGHVAHRTNHRVASPGAGRRRARFLVRLDARARSPSTRVSSRSRPEMKSQAPICVSLRSVWRAGSRKALALLYGSSTRRPSIRIIWASYIRYSPRRESSTCGGIRSILASPAIFRSSR